MFETMEILISVGSMLVIAIMMGLAMIKIASAIAGKQLRGTQAQSILRQLGLGHFSIKDLNVLSDQGFGRLIQLIQVIKGGGSGIMDQLMQMTQLHNMQMNPQDVLPTNPDPTQQPPNTRVVKRNESNKT